jgi:hypothetical protein
MRKIYFVITVLCAVVLAFGNITWAEDKHRIGVGVHYWTALESIGDDDVDEDDMAIMVSYQYLITGYLKLEADLEFRDKGYAGSDQYVFSPQAFLLIGKGLYAGAGIGINYSDSEFADEPFYALRVGIDINILPSLFLDINANYRFEEWDFDKIEDDIDTDTITLGAMLRFQF